MATKCPDGSVIYTIPFSKPDDWYRWHKKQGLLLLDLKPDRPFHFEFLIPFDGEWRVSVVTMAGDDISSCVDAATSVAQSGESMPAPTFQRFDHESDPGHVDRSVVEMGNRVEGGVVVGRVSAVDHAVSLLSVAMVGLPDDA